VVKTRRLFDAPDVGKRDIDGTSVKQLNAMYGRHRSHFFFFQRLFIVRRWVLLDAPAN